MELLIEQYCQALGLPATASMDQIKRAYHELALKFHPDSAVVPHSMEKFIQIHDAYKHLLCLTNRWEYFSTTDPSEYLATAEAARAEELQLPKTQPDVAHLQMARKAYTYEAHPADNTNRDSGPTDDGTIDDQGAF